MSKPSPTTHEAEGTVLAEFLRDAPQRWFDLDLEALAIPLAGFAAEAAALDPMPLRLEVLLASFAPDTPLAATDPLWERAVASVDADAAAMVCTAAVDRVIHEGADFQRLHPWAARIDTLLNADTLSPTARCALLLRQGLLVFVADCDIAAAERCYEQQLAIALQLRSIPQRLQYAAWRAYIDCQAGHLDRSDIILTEARALCEQPGVPPLPRALVTSSLGMVRTLQGRAEDACAILRAAAEAPDFQRLPPFVQTTLLCHRLYALAQTGSREEIAAVADAIRGYTVPANRAFLNGYLHFALGAAELRQGAPLRALMHAEQNENSFRSDSSHLGDSMRPLVQIQALSDLRREEEALRLLEQWLPRWRARRMHRVAAVGLLEKAHIHARAGELDRARQAFAAIRQWLPEGEPLVALNRDPAWLPALRATVQPTDAAKMTTPVRIRTLGQFSVEIEGTTLDERDWRGRRSKMLLQGLIAMGGQPVSGDELADWIWPDSEGAQAQQNLKAVLWRLRRIGRDGTDPLNWIQVKHGRLTLSRALCEVDAHEFQTAATALLASDAPAPEALQRALDLYAGEFLPGESQPPAVIAFRRRLHDLWTRLLACQREANRA